MLYRGAEPYGLREMASEGLLFVLFENLVVRGFVEDSSEEKEKA